MKEFDNNLQQALQDWRQSSLDQVRSLAADLGNRHFAAGIPVLVQLLDHEDEIVRYNAVNSLAFEFGYKPAAERLLTMLAVDPAEDCRLVAGAALGNLFQNSKDRDVLAALAKAAINDPDEDVRSSAYKALLIVNGVSREEHLRVLTGPSLPVDPARVKAILEQLSE